MESNITNILIKKFSKNVPSLSPLPYLNWWANYGLYNIYNVLSGMIMEKGKDFLKHTSVETSLRDTSQGGYRTS